MASPKPWLAAGMLLIVGATALGLWRLKAREARILEATQALKQAKDQYETVANDPALRSYGRDAAGLRRAMQTPKAALLERADAALYGRVRAAIRLLDEREQQLGRAIVVDAAHVLTIGGMMAALALGLVLVLRGQRLRRAARNSGNS